VAHGERIRDYLHGHGIAIELVTGDTPDAERTRLVSDFKAGTLRALVNVNVLSTGFDAPHTDLLAFLRPTKSPGLYIQACGRGMRIAPGKTDCLVLDFAGNIAEHGPVDNVRPPKRRGKSTEPAPMRECDECGALMAPATRECPGCGKVFEIQDRGTQISAQASDLAIMSKDVKPDSITPTRYRVSIHSKPGKPDSLRVDWYAGIRKAVTEWVCLFHDGYAQERAHRWWAEHVGGPLPDTLEDAIERAAEIRMPAELRVSRVTEYPSIVGRSFAQESAA
jgi:DNA repair protein RadD